MDAPEVTTTVRIPLSRIAAQSKDSHSILPDLSSAEIEAGYLVLTFSGDGGHAIANSARGPKVSTHSALSVAPEPTLPPPSSPPAGPRRRRLAKRNRMKTRGWNIVAKMTNSKGQTVAIYEPFVLALRGKKLRRRALAKLVSDALAANGNKPGPTSVEYYLSNTLEYLAKEPGQ